MAGKNQQLSGNSPSSVGSGAHDMDVTPTDGSNDIVCRAERLRIAVKKAGGNAAVARRARMHVGTLDNYLRGRDMKAGAMIKLAAACDVRLDWLATGQSPEKPEHYVSAHREQLPGPGKLAYGPVMPIPSQPDRVPTADELEDPIIPRHVHLQVVALIDSMAAARKLTLDEHTRVEFVAAINGVLEAFMPKKKPNP